MLYTFYPIGTKTNIHINPPRMHCNTYPVCITIHMLCMHRNMCPPPPYYVREQARANRPFVMSSTSTDSTDTDDDDSDNEDNSNEDNGGIMRRMLSTRGGGHTGGGRGFFGSRPLGGGGGSGGGSGPGYRGLFPGSFRAATMPFGVPGGMGVYGSGFGGGMGNFFGGNPYTDSDDEEPEVDVNVQDREDDRCVCDVCVCVCVC